MNTIIQTANQLRQNYGDQAMLVAIERALIARAKGDNERADFLEAVALQIGRAESCDA